MKVIPESTNNYFNSQFTTITLGEVVDVDDPQQMGRLRVYCPSLGDIIEQPDDIDRIPFATYVTPFGGSVFSDQYERGPAGDKTPLGHLAYGMWAIPQKGAMAIVACLDGDNTRRVWLGCIYNQNVQNSLPAGRHTIGEEKAGHLPLNSNDAIVNPSGFKASKAFGGDTSGVPEWLTRGAEYAAAIIHDDLRPHVFSSDSFYGDEQNGDINQGYVVDESLGTRPGENEDKLRFYQDRKYRYSPTTSITTPGFHTLLMDDRAENCRIRVKTVGGNQILLDDTNERIYISTGSGESWIEIDESGTIDIYSKRNVSVHAEKDINFTADENINLFAGQNINLRAGKDLLTNVAGNLHIQTNEMQMNSATETTITSNNVNIKAAGNLVLTGDSSADLFGGVTKVDSAGSLNLKGGDVKVTGGAIHLNGPPAVPAAKATTASPAPAFFTGRVPQHEPWPRTMTKDYTTHDPEFDSASESVNRVERGETIERNDKWRR